MGEEAGVEGIADQVTNPKFKRILLGFNTCEFPIPVDIEILFHIPAKDVAGCCTIDTDWLTFIKINYRT